MQITIRRVGPPIEKIEKDIKLIRTDIFEGVKALAYETRDYMRNIIQTTKKRKMGSRDNLERAIDVETSINTTGDFIIGVGRLDHLDEVAPYWKIINDGGMAGPSGRVIYGAFDMVDAPSSSMRGSGVGTQSFFVNSKGLKATFGPGASFPMKITSPIKPFRYIEQTFTWLQTRAFTVITKKDVTSVVAR